VISRIKGGEESTVFVNVTSFFYPEAFEPIKLGLFLFVDPLKIKYQHKIKKKA